MARSELNLFDLAVGKQIFDRYHIDEALAGGPLSARFAVTDQTGNQPLHMEVFTAGLFEGHGQASFFAEGLKAVGKANCSVVVPTVRMHVTDAGDVLRFSERPKGENLRATLQAGKTLSRSEAVQMGLLLLQGMLELHSQGFAHGDIKPDTIYVSDKVVHMTESGVTPALWRAQHMGARTTLIGTPFYAPLEQFSGETPDSGSDLYAIGTVLYESLCGVLPWSGKGFIEVFQSKMQDNPPPIESRAKNLRVGKDLEEVLRKSIRGRRADRYLNAVEFLSALQKAAAEPVG